MMRIGLNLIGFMPATSGGIETYIKNLLQALQHLNSRNEYLVLCDESVANEFLISNPAFRLQTVRFQRYSARWLLRGIIQRAISYDILKKVLDPLGLDVIHHPFTVLNPLGLRTPSVLTFHDMQQEFYPEFFTRAELLKRNASYHRSASEADVVIAISTHVKTCLIEKYHMSPDKVVVVHSGCGPEFKSIIDPSALDMVRRIYSLHRPFMFYPAATWPHKNHCTLLEVLRTLIDQNRFDGELVMTGVKMEAHNHLMEKIKLLKLMRHVRILGFVPAEHLPHLYKLASLLVFPSLFEGFGLPLIEAMASGCPVVCSNVTALPEIVGDCALTFDPLSHQEMAAAIETVWNDRSLQLELKQKGLVRAELFQWDITARKTEEVYSRVSKNQ